ncbi:MAG TPA: 50S ribosomal protein L1 [Nevskiaceae bacterium]|nr:50S ribosomal protein L1 [Nevskiaceae bacterium]
MERRGKKFREAAKNIEKGKAYTLPQAIDLAAKTNPAKFDASVELHVRLGVDPRHADQNIRDNLVLPAGTGKTVRVAVFADDNAEGADISGVETLLKQLEKGDINFDILISTPANMPKLGKYARVLGPRGLMPNPKSGTVTTDIARAVSEAKAGRVEYRVDTTGIVHLAIGKVSFGKAKLEENARAVLASIKANKPASVKGTYVKAIHLTTTMGPSITVETSEL